MIWYVYIYICMCIYIYVYTNGITNWDSNDMVLVGGLEHVLFSIIYGIIRPID